MIELNDDGLRVRASVRDDGRGFGATASSDGGLVHMVERIEAVGGVHDLFGPRWRDGRVGVGPDRRHGRPSWRRPRTRRLAWSAFAATAACAVVHGALVLSGSAGMVTAEEGLSAFPIITLGCVLGALVGAMVAVLTPADLIGWLLLVGQLGVGIGLVAAAFAVRVLEDADLGPLLAGRTATVVGSVLGAGWALTIMTAVFLLFPDGSLPSGRWRAVLWALPVPQVVVVLTTVVLVPLDSITAVGADFDRLSPTVAVVRAVASALSVGFLLLGIAALVLRLRRATGERRQQLRWLTTAAAALVAGFALAVLVGLGGVGGTQVWGVAPLFLWPMPGSRSPPGSRSCATASTTSTSC